MSASTPIQSRSPVSVPGPKGRRPWSTILLRQWAAMRYPGVRLWEQVRLGPTICHLVGVDVTPALEAALRIDNWYADGILMLPNEVLLIESKMEPTPAAVGQVQFYLRQAFRTPDLQKLLAIPFVPVVLFAEDDNDVSLFARQAGCRVEIWTPPWIVDYLTQVQFRNRTTIQAIASAAAPQVENPQNPQVGDGEGLKTAPGGK